MWENKQEMVKQTHPSAEGNCLSECIYFEINKWILENMILKVICIASLLKRETKNS